MSGARGFNGDIGVVRNVVWSLRNMSGVDINPDGMGDAELNNEGESFLMLELLPRLMLFMLLLLGLRGLLRMVMLFEAAMDVESGMVVLSKVLTVEEALL
jgi:hypothetical protein